MESTTRMAIRRCATPLCVMAQDFALPSARVGQGNLGLMDGDSAAAYRYTGGKAFCDSRRNALWISRKTRWILSRTLTVCTRSRWCFRRSCRNFLQWHAPVSRLVWRRISRRITSELVDGIAHLIENPEASTEDLLKFISRAGLFRRGHYLQRQRYSRSLCDGSREDYDACQGGDHRNEGGDVSDCRRKSPI